MSAFFAQSPSKGDTTALLIDVENGSVASALARLSLKDPVKLFGEERVQLPILQRVSSAVLAQKIDLALEAALLHTGEVAAQLRQSSASDLGHISSVRIFLSAPWASTSQEAELRWSFEPEIITALHRSAGIITNNAPVYMHPFSRAAAAAAQIFAAGESLMCTLTGELVELALVQDGQVRGRATMPLGYHTVLRTLQSHAGISLHEARSAVRLAHQTNEIAPKYAEPLDAAAAHLAAEFAELAAQLLTQSEARTIFIIAPEPMGDWFAKALTRHERAASLFPDGGIVRTVKPKFCTSFIANHAIVPDLPLMLEAMFISASHRKKNKNSSI